MNKSFILLAALLFAAGVTFVLHNGLVAGSEEQPDSPVEQAADISPAVDREQLSTTAAENLFIDWDNLTNPILVRENCMLKDQAVVFHKGWFYIFTSHRFEDGYTGDKIDISTRQKTLKNMNICP
jgi:hypothetical protein